MVTIGIWERKFSLSTMAEIPMRVMNPESGCAPQIYPEDTDTVHPSSCIRLAKRG
jgi:hypothetical protein